MMRAGWLCLMLLVGCSVPELPEVGRTEPYACDTEHPCSLGSRCVAGFCQSEALALTVTYQGFLPRCVRVIARDVEGTRESQSTDLLGVGSTTGGSLSTVILRGKDWSRTLEVTAEAFERATGSSCDGQPAARVAKSFTLKDGTVLEETLTLQGQDADADGFLARASGGSDCDDARAEVRPGAQEACNERDDNCDGQRDEGFEVGQVCDDGRGCQGAWACTTAGSRSCGVTESQWYPDQDNDGRGARNGTPRSSCTQPAGYVPNSDDCDDANPRRYVGAPELCNSTDEDCDPANDPVNGLGVGEACTNDVCDGRKVCSTDGRVVCDAQPPVQKYVDNDLDSHGATGTALVKLCAQPDGSYPSTGYATIADDCDDNDAQRFPGNTELCNDTDEDCDGNPANGFVLNAPCTPAGACTGRTICNAQGTGTSCEALTYPKDWFPDEDLDAYGDKSAPVSACGAPKGYIARGGDCDDGDPFTHEGAPELCDLKDNDCDTVDDGAGVCPASRGWASYRVGSSVNDWYSVSLYGSGGVWAVGTNGARALKTPADSAFKLQQLDCGGTWNASWAESASGELFLGGNGGLLGMQGVDSTGCSPSQLFGQSNTLGLMGFLFPLTGTLRLHGVGSSADSKKGATLLWEGRADPVIAEVVDPLYDVHGLSSGPLFAVGGLSDNSEARIYRYNSSTRTWSRDLNLPTTNPGSRLNAVWVVNEKLAYAVGLSSTVLKWNGTDWQRMSGTPPYTFTSVLAFGSSAVYVTTGSGDIYRFNGQKWELLFNGTPILRDLAGTSPADLWAVGDDGTIVHWPQ